MIRGVDSVILSYLCVGETVVAFVWRVEVGERVKSGKRVKWLGVQYVCT